MNKENSGMIYTAIICLGLIALILWIFLNAVFGNEVPQKQKEISVILYSAGIDGWESFQEGVKQAENDFSVNINVVVLREDADAAEQLEIMKREVNNGAEALAVAVADYKELYEKMLQDPVAVPIVSVESGFDDSIPLISADNYEMGKRLGEEILKDFSGKGEVTVALANEKNSRDSVERRKQGLLDALEGKAKVITLRSAINGKDADAVVALHKESLLRLPEKSKTSLRVPKYYGIGNTASVVAALDQGKIDKLVFQNEFNMGYLAIKMLLQEINGIQNKETEPIDFYCVTGKDLYDSKYEHLLFPIVE